VYLTIESRLSFLPLQHDIVNRRGGRRVREGALRAGGLGRPVEEGAQRWDHSRAYRYHDGGRATEPSERPHDDRVGPPWEEAQG
jgi:hypothetical protein